MMRAPVAEIDAFTMGAREFGERLILNDGFDGPLAEQALIAGQGAAVSFGRHFIANPDLVHRLAQGIALARFDRKTLYTPGAGGYSDYPAAA